MECSPFTFTLDTIDDMLTIEDSGVGMELDDDVARTSDGDVSKVHPSTVMQSVATVRQANMRMR